MHHYLVTTLYSWIQIHTYYITYQNKSLHNVINGAVLEFSNFVRNQLNNTKVNPECCLWEVLAMPCGCEAPLHSQVTECVHRSLQYELGTDTEETTAPSTAQRGREAQEGKGPSPHHNYTCIGWNTSKKQGSTLTPHQVGSIFTKHKSQLKLWTPKINDLPKITFIWAAPNFQLINLIII